MVAIVMMMVMIMLMMLVTPHHGDDQDDDNDVDITRTVLTFMLECTSWCDDEDELS